MIHDEALLGEGVLIYDSQSVSLGKCEVGDNTKIHPFVVIQDGVKIGRNCKIQPFVFIPEGVTIGDGVFIGPHTCFINDRYPRSLSSGGAMVQAGEWKLEPTVIHDGASIGAAATILCGVTVGKGSLVGAGAVVTRDVGEGVTVKGNPAKEE